VLIKLSAGNLLSVEQFRDVIHNAALAAGCVSIIAWAKPHRAEVRFILVDDPLSRIPATFEQHDYVISTLLMIDRNAIIRTSKFTYNGWADFSAQFMEAAPGERLDATIKTDTNAS